MALTDTRAFFSDWLADSFSSVSQSDDLCRGEVWASKLPKKTSKETYGNEWSLETILFLYFRCNHFVIPKATA